MANIESGVSVAIVNGTIVNHDASFKANVLIVDGIIQYIGPDPDCGTVVSKPRFIDATDKLLIPGGVDPNTHLYESTFNIPTSDDFFDGTKAAIAGGTTTVIDLIMPESGETLPKALQRWRSMADSKVCCDYGLHACIPAWTQQISADLETMSQSGVNSFKMFMSYKGIYQMCDSTLLETLENLRKIGAIALVHAENGDIIRKNVSKLVEANFIKPSAYELSRQQEVEAEAVYRACVLAHQIDCPLYVPSITSKMAAVELARARYRYKNRGIFGEAPVACLCSTGERARSACLCEATSCIRSPPLRSDRGTPALLMSLLSSDQLQTTASDNCTHSKEQKMQEDFTKIPPGTNGIEERMSLVWELGVVTGLIDENRFVAITSTNAAKIFNLYPRKGCIQVGSDGDIVIWNPKASRKLSCETHHLSGNFNFYEGKSVHGSPEIVLVRGRICSEDGLLQVERGYGRFLKIEPRSPFVYDYFDAKATYISYETKIEEKNKLLALDLELIEEETISRTLNLGKTLKE